jgi:hypothetical protein
MAFPANLTNAIDGVTDVIADHLNHLEAKVGIDDSLVTTSLDYLLKNSASIDPGHKHTSAAISGLQTALDAKANNSDVIAAILGPATTTAQKLGTGDSPTFAGIKFGSASDLLQVTDTDDYSLQIHRNSAYGGPEIVVNNVTANEGFKIYRQSPSNFIWFKLQDGSGATLAVDSYSAKSILSPGPGVALKLFGGSTAGLILGDTVNDQTAIVLGGQIGIGTMTPNAAALLHLSSTTMGFLPPVMTTAQKTAISGPTAGLVVYDSDLNKLCVYTGSAWETITSA